jgi:hypothetical protein
MQLPCIYAAAAVPVKWLHHLLQLNGSSRSTAKISPFTHRLVVGICRAVRTTSLGAGRLWRLHPGLTKTLPAAKLATSEQGTPITVQREAVALSRSLRHMLLNKSREGGLPGLATSVLAALKFLVPAAELEPAQRFLTEGFPCQLRLRAATASAAHCRHTAHPDLR